MKRFGRRKDYRNIRVKKVRLQRKSPTTEKNLTWISCREKRGGEFKKHRTKKLCDSSKNGSTMHYRILGERTIFRKEIGNYEEFCLNMLSLSSLENIYMGTGQ